MFIASSFDVTEGTNIITILCCLIVNCCIFLQLSSEIAGGTVAIDKTLSEENKAAEAAATGEAITQLSNRIAEEAVSARIDDDTAIVGHMSVSIWRSFEGSSVVQDQLVLRHPVAEIIDDVFNYY